MSDVSVFTPEAQPARLRRRHQPRHIKLPNGDVLWPRKELAEKKIGVDERTAKRWGWPTVYIANVAYCPHDECLKIVTARMRRPNEPPARRRNRR